MTDKLRLIVLGISVILLNGCGGSSDGGSSDTSNTTTGEATNIVGTWSSGCVNYSDFGASVLETYTFNADGSGSYSFSEYDALNCNDTDQILGQSASINYSIGNETTAKDGETAQEFYTLPTNGGRAYFSMVRLDGNILYIASSQESDRDGYTAETRENDFSDVYPFFKQ